MQFSEKKVAETITLGFDLVRILGEGETIQTAVFSAAVATGDDATPGAMIAGSASITGSIVKQHITGGLPGVYYTIEVAVDTDQGNHYIERGRLGVVA